MDVLSDILQTFRLRSSVFAMSELAAPWGMCTAGRPESIFHVILRGTAWLDADGVPPRQVTAGDVVLVAPERRHSLRDHKKSRARPIEELLAEGYFAPGRKSPQGDSTQVLCGCFHVDDSGAKMLLSALPAVVHLRDTPEVAPWIEHTVKLMTYEAGRERPGARTVVNRLCDALFVFVLRGVLESMSPTASWLRGLSDPHVGAAMRLVHERPADPWSVASLAQKVGLSRSGRATCATSCSRTSTSITPAGSTISPRRAFI